MVKRRNYRATPDNQGGFTLVELVIALGITALIGATAYAALAGVSQSRQAYQQRSDEVAEIQRFFMIVGNDLRQTAAVTNLDESAVAESAFILDNGSANPLVFNRRGWHNPLGNPRSELQRVFYRLEDEQLIRGYWLAFDRQDDEDFREQALMEGVQTFSVRALPPTEVQRLDRAWVERWPVAQIEGSTDLPIAVEIAIETVSHGRLTRIYEL